MQVMPKDPQTNQQLSHDLRMKYEESSFCPDTKAKRVPSAGFTE